MNTTLYNHNSGQFPSGPKTRLLLAQLIDVAKRAPVYIWPGKSDKDKKHMVLQSAINMWFELELDTLGWNKETSIISDDHSTQSYRVDFSQFIDGEGHVMVEVEFGNSARLDSDLRKFLDAFHRGRLTLGILILPRNRLANLTTKGSVGFEKAVADVRRCHPKTVPFSLCIIGLDHEGADIIDLSQALDIPGPGYLSKTTINSAKKLRHVIAQHRSGIPAKEILCLENMTTSMVPKTEMPRKMPLTDADLGQQPLFSSFLPEDSLVLVSTLVKTKRSKSPRTLHRLAA